MSQDAQVISFLASHGGSAVKHMINAIKSGELDACYGVVITNNRDSEIYRWCTESGINIRHISGRTHPHEEAKDLAISGALAEARTSIVILSGYMKKIGPMTLEKYSGKILNIHPSLLPKHGGKGMFGDRVHESVLRDGDLVTGATVHYINAEYDEGPIIIQRSVRVAEGETISTLKSKVQAIEGPLYIEAIKKIL